MERCNLGHHFSSYGKELWNNSAKNYDKFFYLKVQIMSYASISFFETSKPFFFVVSVLLVSLSRLHFNLLVDLYVKEEVF